MLIVFTLRESNTFSPDGVGRRAVRLGTASVNVENHQCLPGCGRISGTVLRNGGNLPQTGFCKKQNFGTPRTSILPENNDFLPSRAILTSSGWRLGGRPPSATGQPLPPVIFDILNWGLASGGDGVVPIIGRPGGDRQNGTDFSKLNSVRFVNSV